MRFYFAPFIAGKGVYSATKDGGGVLLGQSEFLSDATYFLFVMFTNSLNQFVTSLTIPAAGIFVEKTVVTGGTEPACESGDGRLLAIVRNDFDAVLITDHARITATHALMNLVHGLLSLLELNYGMTTLGSGHLDVGGFPHGSSGVLDILPESMIMVCCHGLIEMCRCQTEHNLKHLCLGKAHETVGAGCFCECLDAMESNNLLNIP